MKKPFCLGLFAALFLVAVVSESFAGPRGGGARLGGSRPAPSPSRPSGNFNPGGNLGNTRLGDTNLNSGSLSGRLNSGTSGLSNLNLSGHDKLSSMLEGKTLPQIGSGTGPTQDRLQNFLGLSDGSRTLPDDGQNRQQQLSDKKSELQPKADQAKQNFSQRSTEIQNNVNHYLQGQPKPFSPQWYAAHPNAFQYQYPHADAWTAATFGAVTGWVLGASTAPVNYVYNDNSVVYAENNEAAPVANSSTGDSQTPDSTSPANSNEEWMPLGVYALVQGNQTQAQMLMQLAVSKTGKIDGSYYNILSDNSQPLTGSLDKQTQQVAWKVANNQKVTFQTDLTSLTEPETPVMVHFGDGSSQKMTLVRLPEKST
ncbi:hypothetical protein GC197_00980 [bacterium]|nr:hypothetical protein [bacterium]